MGKENERFCARTQRGGNEDSRAALDPDRKRRYAELFEQLDLNKDGRVDTSELRTGLAARGLHQREAEEVRKSRGPVQRGTAVHTDARTATHSQLAYFTEELQNHCDII